MKPNLVRFVSPSMKFTSFQNTNAYLYSPAKGWAWLQRLCFKFLKWRQCYFMDTLNSVTYTTIDVEPFVENLFRQCEEIKHFFGPKPMEILVGTKDFYQIMNSKDDVQREYFNFTTEFGYNGKLFGLKVKVIPWMDGILVMP